MEREISSDFGRPPRLAIRTPLEELLVRSRPFSFYF
jgi:hypothetical protein